LARGRSQAQRKLVVFVAADDARAADCARIGSVFRADLPVLYFPGVGLSSL
jgi:hypothetical protein